MNCFLCSIALIVFEAIFVSFSKLDWMDLREPCTCFFQRDTYAANSAARKEALSHLSVASAAMLAEAVMLKPVVPTVVIPVALSLRS
jgi:hypothetical protein